MDTWCHSSVKNCLMAGSAAICSPRNVAVITCDWAADRRGSVSSSWGAWETGRHTWAQRLPLTAAASAKWLLHVSFCSAQRIPEATTVYRVDLVFFPLTPWHFNWTASFGRQAARRLHRFLKTKSLSRTRIKPSKFSQSMYKNFSAKFNRFVLNWYSL